MSIRCDRWRAPGCVVAGLLLLSSIARADEPEAPPASGDSAGAPQDDQSAPAPEKKKADTEFTILPVVGGDSDVGFGGGYIASLARVVPDLEPYLWRAEAAGSITFKPDHGKLDIPYLDNYLLLSFPHVIRNRFGIEVRISHTHEEFLGYYGLGNASTKDDALGDTHYQYARTHPTLQVDLTYEPIDYVKLTWGASYTYNELDIPEGSKLAEDLASDDAQVRDLLNSSNKHGVATFSYGLGWDSRDNEVSPTGGQYHTLRFDLSPGATEGVPFDWMRVNLAMRTYVTMLPKHLVFAVRVVLDSLTGNPPFYELARYDNTYAVGGGKGVRGIPAQRYHGKLKVFSNLELRASVLSFKALSKDNELGFVAFFDSGRVWADYRSSGLDGEGLGLKTGVGGGVRIQAGKSFVLRADVAGSPSEGGGISAYLAGGQIF
jgi:surface antigen Omp85-like protein